MTQSSSLRVQRRAGFPCRIGGSPTTSAAATILWIHGLGESGLGFQALLESSQLASFHHVAPDLVGYGRSLWPADAPLTLGGHAESLLPLLDHLLEEEPDRKIVVVGHSMGGVIGQILCEAKPNIAAFVNVEGNLSLGDCGYSGKAAPQSREEFLTKGYQRLGAEIFDLAKDDSAHRTYFASYSLCHPATFHQNARELVQLSEDEGLARRFAQLGLAKAFVHGVPQGSPPRSRELLNLHDIQPKVFEPAGHWPFIDYPAEFCTWLASWISKHP